MMLEKQNTVKTLNEMNMITLKVNDSKMIIAFTD